MEMLLTGEMIGTEDATEGINDFLEKREPDWKEK